MPASGKMVASETMIALPIAVARCSWKRSIAAMTSSRLRVGACATVAVPAKATTPMRTFSGCSATNCLAAFCAATRRLGSTSVARMLPEMSMARITVSCCVGSVIVACGRASAEHHRGQREEEKHRRDVAPDALPGAHRLAHHGEAGVAHRLLLLALQDQM